MIATEASAAFAMIVGLICNWKQERGSQATDRYQDFMAWLVQHNFNDLQERIYQSEELQRDLTTLLQQDLTVINDKLDIIAGSISAVANKIDFLSQTSRTLGADTDALSQQASQILKAFAHSGADFMCYHAQMQELWFLPVRTMVRLNENRFISDDLASLVKLGFIRIAACTSSGSPKYVITRLGCSFAENLSELSI